MQLSKDEMRWRNIEKMLESARNGSVIVEGKHDVKVLAQLGIQAISYDRLFAGVLPGDGTVYIMTDRDRGGEVKKEKIISRLLELGNAYTLNENLGKKMLGMLNVTSVEQMLGPVEEAFEKIGDNFGKNVFGYCKVHGLG